MGFLGQTAGMLNRFGIITVLTVSFVALFFYGCEEKAKWYKGNLHTHTFWSDGNDFPEMVVDWYKVQGYDFLALSDHNILLDQEKWVTIGDRKDRLTALEKYKAKYDPAWIESKTVDGELMVRLKRLDEFKPLFDEPGKFLLVPSEEITDEVGDKEVHLNATNIQSLIKPQGGETVLQALQNNVNAVLAQREETGVPMIPHINHPNFGWSVTAEDIIAVENERFFEVYNGHPSVHNMGDERRPGTDRMWDIILTQRLSQGGQIMYGVATDDAHSYHEMKQGRSNPGRGWIMVNMEELTAEHLVAAMEAGRFYSTTGVTLSRIRFNGKTISIGIDAAPGVTYTTQFIGTVKDFPAEVQKLNSEDGDYVQYIYSDAIGKELARSDNLNPEYTLKGDELYVRVRITSSKSKDNPNYSDEKETAWTQPFRYSSAE